MVGIVFIGDLKYCPYLNQYTKILDEENEKYEVLFWNREANEKNYPNNYLSFKKKSKLNKLPMMKALDFFEYKIWLNHQMKKRNYDKLIILSTLSGILMSDLIIRRYSEKYIYDIRDYSYEHNKIFYDIERSIIYKSFFTCISAEGFRAFLPKDYSYVKAHNFNKEELQYKRNFIKKDRGAALNLVWIGAVRYFDHQKHIIDRLKNDNRFNLSYHGSGADLEIFMKYCEENKITNVKFTGEYKLSDKSHLLVDADIVNNCYMTRKLMEVKYAISNKYYDGLIYGIPQLVETRTYKHEKVLENGIGIGLDVNSENFGDQLYNYYFSIDETEFNSSCCKLLNDIVKEDSEYRENIYKFVRSHKTI